MNKRKKIYTVKFLEMLYEWYGKGDDNDLTIFKVNALLFLFVANNKELLDIFDSFEAWMHGPVEVEVYNFLKKQAFIDDEGLKLSNILESKNYQDYLEKEKNQK